VDDQAELAAVKRQCGEAAAVLERFPALVDRMLALTAASQTGFGEKAVGSADFVRHVRGGRDFRLSTVLRALQHMHQS